MYSSLLTSVLLLIIFSWKVSFAFLTRDTQKGKVNVQERDHTRRRGVLNLFEGSLRALEQRKPMVSSASRISSPCGEIVRRQSVWRSATFRSNKPTRPGWALLAVQASKIRAAARNLATFRSNKNSGVQPELRGVQPRASALPTACPQARRVEGGNCWRAYRRVRLVIEQARQEVEKDKVNNHKYGR
jgi:hypothetical protein